MVLPKPPVSQITMPALSFYLGIQALSSDVSSARVTVCLEKEGLASCISLTLAAASPCAASGEIRAPLPALCSIAAAGVIRAVHDAGETCIMHYDLLAV